MRKLDRRIIGTAATLLILFLIGGVLIGRAAPRGDVYEYLTNFREVLHLVTANYVEEVDMDELMEGVFQGMMESLDAENVYLDPAAFARYQKGQPPKADHLGLTVSKRFNYAVVVASTAGGPAARAGLIPGDYIRSIDGLPVRQMNLVDVRAALSGEIGSKVTLTLIHQQNAEREELTLTRAEVTRPRPELLALPDGIRYVRLHEISPGADSAFSGLLAGISTAGESEVRGVILDLRNNPGSSLDAAVTVADLLLDSGTIVSVEGREGVINRYEAKKETTRYGGPLTVLVDRGTANAAEVVAAALQQNGRATVVGELTFGQGAVQEVIPLSNGGALLLSVARFYSPSGDAFQEEGVTPDVEVEMDSETPWPALTIGPTVQSLSADPFVQAALEALRSSGDAEAEPEAA